LHISPSPKSTISLKADTLMLIKRGKRALLWEPNLMLYTNQSWCVINVTRARVKWDWCMMKARDLELMMRVKV